MNHRKLQARCSKLSKLLHVIDLQSIHAKLSLTEDALLIAERVEQAPPEFWKSASAEAGCNVPSDESIRTLVVFLRDRANQLPEHVKTMSPREFGRWEAVRLGEIVAQCDEYDLVRDFAKAVGQ